MDYPRLKMTVQKGKRMKIREVNQVSLDEIAGYMNDEIRDLHSFPTRRSSDLNQRTSSR